MTDAAFRPSRRTAPAEPLLWVVGSFGMTGAPLARHAAECVASTAATGAEVLTLSFHPGAYAETDVAAAARLGVAGQPCGIVYLRCLTKVTGGGLRRGLGAWRRRFAALSRLIRQSGHVVLVRDTIRPGLRARLVERAVESALRLLLAAGPGPRPRPVSAHVPPATLLQRYLRLPAKPVSPSAAEERVFGRIRDRSAAELRLTDTHVMRALDSPLAAGLTPSAREDLLRLARRARRISERDVEAALRQTRLRVGPGTSPAVRAALEKPNGSDLPAIAAHLRALGKPRRQWRRFAPAAKYLPGASGLEAAILRVLSDRPLPTDARLLADFHRAVCADPGAPTRLEWFLYVALRLPVDSMETLAAPWRSAGLAQRLAERMPPGISPRARGEARELRLVGIAGNGTGLSQNYWMSARALDRAGLAPRLEPVDAAPGTLVALPPAAVDAAPFARLARDVTLMHLNADRIPQEILSRHRDRNEFHVGFLLWELDRLPAAHRLALRMLDEIWVPSVFLKRLYAPHFDRQVLLMRKGIALPPPASWPAPPPGVRRFTVCFDQRSSVARKNPLAAVRAFATAFGARRDVELIVKTTGANPGGWGDPEGQMDAIRAAAARDPRIRIIERDLPFAALLGLIASADCLVSPHRAEGFGYMPAFALSLGVPVIATDYSGTCDFCTAETSDPVPARLVRVPRGQAILPTPGARWAEVEIDALAGRMVALADDPGPARRRAARGRATMLTDYSMTALSARYRARLDALGLLLPGETAAQDAPAGTQG